MPEQHVYAVAYLTVDDKCQQELFVETIIATSPEEAIGKSMLEHRGSEIMNDGDASGIIGVHVYEQNNDDVEAMIERNTKGDES